MPAKQVIVLAAQAGLVFFAWWATRSEDERRTMQAGLWRELEALAMRCAKASSNFAAYAERRYKETVSA
jgi:hypothetical protein